MTSLRSLTGRKLACSSVLAIVAMAMPGTAHANCVQSGTVIDCTGSVVSVNINSDNHTLNVATGAEIDAGAGIPVYIRGEDNQLNNDGTIRNNLNNQPTIDWRSTTGAITLVNNGSILSDGTGVTQAIEAISDIGPITITNGANGLISSDNTTIYAETDGSIAIDNSGTIERRAGQTFTGAEAGIWVRSGFAGNAAPGTTLAVTNSGSIVTDLTAGYGIRAEANGADTSVANSGDITGSIGILVAADSGAASIINSGTIDARVFGIKAQVGAGSGPGSLLLNNQGDITADSRAILANVFDGGAAQIVNTGTARSSGSALTIFGFTGNAYGAANATVENSGELRSSNGRAVFVQTDGGLFNLNNTGTIASGARPPSQGGGLFPAIESLGTRDRIITSGTLDGGVSLGDLDDTMQVLDGTINGDMDGGTGADSLAFDTVTAFTYADTISNFESVAISGPVVFDGARVSAADSFDISAGGQLVIPTTSSIDAATLTQAGTLALEPGATLSISGDWVAQAGSTTIFAIDATFPAIMVSGDVTIDAASTVEVDVRNESLLSIGTGFDAVVAGGTLTYGGGTLADNSALFDFDGQVINGNTLRINAIQTLLLPDAVDPGDGNALAVAGSLQDILDSGSGSGGQLALVLGQISDPGALATAVDAFGPGESNAALLSTIAASELPLGAVRDRSDAVRGMGPALWGTATLADGSLGASGSLAGYDSRLTGVAAGADLWIGHDGALRGGIGYAWSDGSADESGNRATTLDSNSNAIFAYLFDQHGKWRFAASLGYGWGSIDSARSIAPLGEIAAARYDTTSWFARAELGRAFATDQRLLMPYAALQIVDARVGEYEESGSLGALSVAARSATSTRADLGLKGQFGNRTAGLSFIARAAVTYELGDLAPGVDAAFLAGGNRFLTQVQDPADFGGLAEGKLQWAGGEYVTLQLGYEGRFAGEYQRHAGRVTLSVSF